MIEKLCPLLLAAAMAGRAAEKVECRREFCGWWNEAAERCAVNMPPVYVLHNDPGEFKKEDFFPNVSATFE